MAMRRPASQLSSDRFRTLGRPTMTTCGSATDLLLPAIIGASAAVFSARARDSHRTDETGSFFTTVSREGARRAKHDPPRLYSAVPVSEPGVCWRELRRGDGR